MQYKRGFLVFGAIAASVGYLFSIATNSIGMIIFALAWILNFNSTMFTKLKQNKKTSVLILFYLLLIVCSIYSVNTHQANKEIVRFLAFGILPIIFMTIDPFNEKESNIIKKSFIICLILFFIACFIYSIYRQCVFFNEGGHFNWYFFYRYDFLEIFRQHPTYVSIYTLLGLCFVVFGRKGKSLFENKTLNFSMILILTFALILYGSRIAYIIYGVLTCLYIFSLLKRQKVKEIIIILSSFVLLLIGAWNVPIVKERILFTLGIQYDYKFNDANSIKDGSPENQGRLLLWKDAFELIKEKPLFGYGTGSSKKILTEKYEKEGHEVFLQEKYNAHNTYLELLLWGGIILLLSYLAVLGSIFYNSLKNKNIIGFCFFLIIFISCITETLFLAQGIMFFAFFYCFLLSKIPSKIETK